MTCKVHQIISSPSQTMVQHATPIPARAFSTHSFYLSFPAKAATDQVKSPMCAVLTHNRGHFQGSLRRSANDAGNSSTYLSHSTAHKEAALRMTICGDYVALTLDRTWYDATSYAMHLVFLISPARSLRPLPDRQDAIEWLSSRTQFKDQDRFSHFETRELSKDIGLGLVEIEH